MNDLIRIKELPPRTFLDPLPAGSAEKAAREASQLRRYARFVIVLDRDGNNIDFADNADPVANVLAVLGPCMVNGTLVEEALLLEIGISKGKPYGQATRHDIRKRGVTGDGRWFLKPRTPANEIPENQRRRVLTYIESALEEITIAVRSEWESKGPAFVPIFIGKGRRRRKKYIECERGVMIWIDARDQWLKRVFLARWRSRKFARSLPFSLPVFRDCQIKRRKTGGQHGQQCTAFEFSFKKEVRERLNL